MADLKKNKEISRLTDLELQEIEFNTKIIGEILKARNGKGITQRELEAITGIKQPMIARIEKNEVDPRLTTIFRLLEPLGLTLAVVPKEAV
ncbi:MAG: helix-turn-helix domain-containing protein [Deferribacteraceae bacterium]|jgi:transcriptional regulator with XRE-family HTH domain|nr:helix-turn-helix domain-containing protein [Deferribacteraceae bacterium]